MNRLIAFCLIIVSNLTYLSAQGQYIVNGIMNQSSNGQYVKLFKLNGNTIHSVDTVTVNNGRFQFVGNEHIIDFSIVTSGNYPDKVMASKLILEKGVINVILDTVSSVSGSLLGSAYQLYCDSISYFDEKRDNISKEKRTFEIESQLQRIYDDKLNYLLNTIKQNRYNLIGKTAFLHELIPRIDLPKEIFDDNFRLLSESVPFSPDELNTIEIYIKIRNKLTINNMFIDLDILTTDGNIKKYRIMSENQNTSLLIFGPHGVGHA